MEIIRRFETLGKGDSAIAGGKGASLGEMIKARGSRTIYHRGLLLGQVYLSNFLQSRSKSRTARNLRHGKPVRVVLG